MSETPYMNQAAKDWLLRALESIHQELPVEAGMAEALQHGLYEEIRALPVVDAVPAEEALEEIVEAAGTYYWSAPSTNIAISNVRHSLRAVALLRKEVDALRAAQAQADAPKEETP